MVAVNSKGELTMTNNQGQQFKLTLAKDCIIITNLTILNFKRPNAKLATFLFAPQPVIVFNFSMNQSASHSNTIHQNELRRLTVWLRWHQHHDI